MNTIYNFLTQTYVPQIPNYMAVGFGLALGAAIVVLLRPNGLIRHFINYGK
jgi:hypothetical protein